jgi:hypothetical protein
VSFDTVARVYLQVIPCRSSGMRCRHSANSLRGTYNQPSPHSGERRSVRNVVRIHGISPASPTRYYQLLNRPLATGKAVAHAAITANRLRRIRLRPGTILDL